MSNNPTPLVVRAVVAVCFEALMLGSIYAAPNNLLLLGGYLSGTSLILGYFFGYHAGGNGGPQQGG